MQMRTPRLEKFDFAIDFPTLAPTADKDADVARFCERALRALPRLGTVRHLTVRKAQHSYLTLPGPMAVLECLGEVVEGWTGLVSTIYYSVG